MADFSLERSCAERGQVLIAGVDEVGRGALCGPVVAAAVVFPSRLIASDPPGWLLEIDDSKLLRPDKRAELARRIVRAASVAVGWTISGEIDRLNVLRATHAAMGRAVGRLFPAPDIVLVDGLPIPGAPFRQIAVPQGDRRSRSIAAASIVAKVLRDELLAFCGRLYDGYGFERHKGYGTEAHFAALDALGPTPLHRRSFPLQSARTLFP